MTEPYRLLITGSRDWTDGPTIWKALAEIARALPLERDLVMVHGACPTGADQMADEWGRGFGATIERHPADWDHCTDACPQGHRKTKRPRDSVHPGVCSDYCPAAGPRRNRELIAGGADLCLAFIKGASRGASHTAALAKQAGIPVRRFTAP